MAEQIEVQSVEPSVEDLARRRRAERYELQALASQMLAHHQHPHGDGAYWRVRTCRRRALPHGDGVRVMLTDIPGRARPLASYSGLQVCASYWLCPVCSARIAERRVAEIAAATALHHAAGGHMLMLTLTLPHTADDELQQLLGKRSSGDRRGLAGALHRLQDSRLWKGRRNKRGLIGGLANSIGLIGSIRALEVTLGAHGWHPHLHVLLLVSRELGSVERRDLDQEIYFEWRRACLASGIREPSRRHGSSLDPAWDASEYLAKFGFGRAGWGPESELARSSTKRGRAGSYGPFDLIREFGATGDCELMDKFCTYATATFRLRPLRWSPGLKRAMGLLDIDDQQIVAGTDEDSRVFLEVSDYLWRCVLAQPPHIRCRILELAEEDGPRGVIDFLDSLRSVRY